MCTKILQNLERGFPFNAKEEIAAFCKTSEDPLLTLLLAIKGFLINSRKTFFSNQRYFSLINPEKNDEWKFINHQAFEWELNYARAIQVAEEDTPLHDDSSCKILATKGSLALYFILALNEMGYVPKKDYPMECLEKYYNILSTYYFSLWDSTLESQILLLAGYFPVSAKQLNEWLDFLNTSKTTTRLKGVIGPLAGDKSRDFYFVPAKRMIKKILSNEFRALERLINLADALIGAKAVRRKQEALATE
jgi:hypothetical protein